MKRDIHSITDLVTGPVDVGDIPQFQAVGGWNSKPLHYLKAEDFYLSGDAGDYAPAVNRAVSAAVAADDRYEIVLPNRAEAYATQMPLSSGMTVRGGGSATEIVQNALTRYFTAQGTHGTKVALTSNAVAHAITITLPTGYGAQFAYGDLIGVEAPAPVVYGIAGWPRDIRRVMRSLAMVTLDAGLLFDYTVANGAVFWKVTPVTGITVKDFYGYEPDPATKYGMMVDIARLRHSGEWHHRAAGGAVILRMCSISGR